MRDALERLRNAVVARPPGESDLVPVQQVGASGRSPSKRRGVHRPLRMLPLIELAVLAIMVAAPLVLNERAELITLITNIAILSLLAISFDLCWGFSGIMTFGQALFFGVPGYVIALVGRDLGLSQIWLTLPLAMIVGLSFAFVVALFLLLGRRPTPIFIALGTLTGSYAAERLVSGWQYVGAGNGLSAIKLLQVGSHELVEGTEFYALACIILLVVYLGARALVRSQFGLVLAGMRQNEERLDFFGYRVQIFKVLVFSLAGMISGLAGALYGYHQGFIGPGNMGPGLSTQAVIYCLLGGSGTLIGPVIGTAVIEILTYVLADIDSIRQFWPVFLGLLLLGIILFQPSGILGMVVSARERIGSYGSRRKGARQPG
ncbi:MAG: branched-chain amino acid ABC transporter permease [Bradyrhizobium sp.]|nr:branched-chain amino acid ABC transporter permease [Bradyrhizobium sp.]